jgi:DNA transformation protein
MARPDPYLDDLLARLATLDGLRSRAMFGGWGLYQAEVFFGIVHRGRLYFRTTPRTRSEYASRGKGPFRPNAKQTLRDYYEVPAEVLDNDEMLLAWARLAVSAAREKLTQGSP